MEAVRATDAAFREVGFKGAEEVAELPPPPVADLRRVQDGGSRDSSLSPAGALSLVSTVYTTETSLPALPGEST
jgi:hypothetical protein